MTTFSIGLSQEDMEDPAKMAALQEVMDNVAEENTKEINKIQSEFGISNEYACAVWYLRTRSRWSQELEDRLVGMAKKNEPAPNMCDWP